MRIVLRPKRTIHVQQRPRLDAAEFAAREAAKRARTAARSAGAEAASKTAEHPEPTP